MRLANGIIIDKEKTFGILTRMRTVRCPRKSRSVPTI